MRELLALSLLTACWHSASPSSSGSSSGSSASPVAPAATTPHTFPPSTDDLAVIYPARALIDEAHGRVFVQRDNGVDVLALATGKPAGHVDIGWDGEMWAAAKMLEMFHTPDVHTVEVALVDHAAASRIATCKHTVKAPTGSQLSRIDAFTYRAQPYLKWETSPPPEMHGGARMSDEEMAAWTKRFQAAYACGLLAVHVKGATCTLDEVSYKVADLESCETRNMPGQRVPASRIIGDIEYSIEETNGPGGGPHMETSTLVVRDRTSSAERWRTVVDERQYIPPPP